MASVTLTTDAANTAKLQAVVNYYNLVNGKNLTIKDWCVEILTAVYMDWNARRITATVATGFSDQVVVT